jgi:hypothetical protein
MAPFARNPGRREGVVADHRSGRKLLAGERDQGGGARVGLRLVDVDEPGRRSFGSGERGEGDRDDAAFTGARVPEHRHPAEVAGIVDEGAVRMRIAQPAADRPEPARQLGVAVIPSVRSFRHLIPPNR